MKFYELTYLISPKLTIVEAQEFSDKIIDLIKKEGGILDEIKNPIKRKLAYQIKKESGGFLTSLNFYFEPEKIENLTKKIDSDDQILRSLILTKKLPRKKELPKIPKIKKEEKVALEEIEKKIEEILGE